MATTRVFAVFLVQVIGWAIVSSTEEIAWCDFQDSYCGWTQDTTDDFDWKRICQTTSSHGTGPSNGQGGLECDTYIYIETSNPRESNDKARIQSEPLGLGNEIINYCLIFWYHMYGYDVNTLIVRLTTDSSAFGQVEQGTQIWTKSGNQGYEWNRAEKSFTVETSNTHVVFEAIRGSGYQGDIAIDSITISTGLCPSDQVATTKPITTDTTTDNPIQYITSRDDAMISDLLTLTYIEDINEVTTGTGIPILKTSGGPSDGREVYSSEDHNMDQFITDAPTIVTVVETEIVDFESTTEATVEPEESTYGNERAGSEDSAGNGIVVVCTKDDITVIFHRQELGYADVTSLRLLDQSCKPQSNSSHVTFRFAPTTCGTLFEENDTTIMYNNLIRSTEGEHLNGIFRNEDVSIPVTCSFDKKSSVNNAFLPVFDRIAFRANGKGTFKFDMDFYQDGTFNDRKEEPIIARIGDMMYFGLSVDISDANMVLYADNCKAVPSETPDHWYYIIQDGCMRDSTIQEFPTSSAHRRLYGIEAFMFLSDGSKIVLECDLVLCDEGDGISRCSSACDEVPDRKRRETNDDRVIIKRSIARTVQLVTSEKNDDKFHSTNQWLTPSSAISMVMFTMAAILCLATVLKIKRDQNRSHDDIT